MEERNKENDSVIISNVYGDVCFRKARKKRRKALVAEMLQDYAKNTTLHGLSYTTKSITLVEKCFWLIIFIVSLCLCSYLINNVWIKWKTSPVIVTISEKLVPVREVPFPSVTICPQSKVKASVYNYSSEEVRLNKIYKGYMQNYDHYFDDPYHAENENASNVDYMELMLANEHNFRTYEHLIHICEDWRLNNQLKYLTFNKLRSEFVSSSETNSILRVAPKREDIFVVCVWRGIIDKNCAKTLTEVITKEGLCYNFNSLAAQEILQDENNMYMTATKSAVNWTMDNGYSSVTYSENEYPFRGSFGTAPDLEIIFQDNQTDRDASCNILNSGFNKVYIHHPADLPQSSLFYYAVRNKEVSSMALSFSIINTSKSLETYDAEKRQCNFPRTIELKYFKVYTASNCMLECLANVTLELCYCAAYYMPRDNYTPTCGYHDAECVYKAQEHFVLEQETKPKDTCQCLAPCYSVEYNAEIMKTNFNLKKLSKQYIISNLSSIQYSKLEMFFKGPRFVSMHRSELFGTTDFFANIGGLLGLFLGFSFLSLVELIYYLTLRLCCALRKDLQEEKIQRKNTINIMAPEIIRH